MIQSRRGTILEELFSRRGIQGFTVALEGRQEKCIVYPDLVGKIATGDEVLLNTTAVDLGLGTGGYHYVMARVDAAGRDMQPQGHIMKLRYTPMQLKVLSVEEQDSPYHEQMLKADSLQGCPVLVATLHSMLAPMCLELAEAQLKVAYVMTDGAALPIAFSQTVDWLMSEKLLVGTVTTGHAFGGDLEAVNIYSGMLAARHVLGADVIIVSMGPGIVGTGTKYGFTGIEQGDILNAVELLGGEPLAVPRISFADLRERHRGISHHSLTVLSKVSRVPALLTLPFMEQEKTDFVLAQLERENIFEQHIVCIEDGQALLDRLPSFSLDMRTMGRGPEQEPEFFMALGASARTAIRLINGQEPSVLRGRSF